MPPRLYSSLAKAVHHWYLGQGGSFTEEDTKLVVALRARGLTWGQIGEETNRYKEEIRVHHEREKRKQAGMYTGGRRGFPMTADEDEKLLRVIEKWLKQFIAAAGLDPSMPGSGANAPACARPRCAHGSTINCAPALAAPRGAAHGTGSHTVRRCVAQAWLRTRRPRFLGLQSPR